MEGAIAPISKNPKSYVMCQISSVLEYYGFDLDTPFEDYSERAMKVLLYGEEQDGGLLSDFGGVVNFICSQFNDSSLPASLQKWAASFMSNTTCPHCHGDRLKAESLCFKIADKNIA